jgi:hypothetical protein
MNVFQNAKLRLVEQKKPTLKTEAREKIGVLI